MERIPGYNELFSRREDNFFPEELDFYNLSHKDKVLLTLRLIRGIRYERFILEDLSEKGKRAYNELFSQKEELSDDILIEILMNTESIEDIVNLRDSNHRFFELTEDPKVIIELAEKFHMKLQDDGTFIDTTYGLPVTFSELLEWYGKSTLNTNKCDDYHDPISCLKFAINTNNVNRLRHMIKRILENEEKLDLVRNAIFERELTEDNVRYIIDNCHEKKSIFENFYLYTVRRGIISQHRILKSSFLVNGFFFEMVDKLDIDLSRIFDNTNNIYLLDRARNFVAVKNFKKILLWSEKNNKSSVQLLILALIFKMRDYAESMKVPKTPENEKIVKEIFRKYRVYGAYYDLMQEWLKKNWQ